MGTRRDATVTAIEQKRISAIIRTGDQSLAADAMEAAVAGGFSMVEFTLTTPRALELVAAFAKRPGLVVGAGTVLTVGQARDAAAAGATFLVSPVCDPKILEEAQALDMASIPGAFTPTEMETAYRLGADFVKVFPAPPGGVDYIHAIRGPLPHLRLFPTAGFTVDNFTQWLSAGCVGVGFVRPLFDPQDLDKRNFTGIRERAEQITRRLAAWQAHAPH